MSINALKGVLESFLCPSFPPSPDRVRKNLNNFLEFLQTLVSSPGLPASWKEHGGGRRPPGPAATPMLLASPGCGPRKAQESR